MDSYKDKIIVTTQRKVKLLQKLSDYWKMKAVMLKSKLDPKIMTDSAFQNETLNYLKDNSDLQGQKFWNSLSPELQKKAIQYFALQEVSDVSNVRIVATKDKAALYICLSGSAEVKIGDSGEEMIIGPGGVFGASDLFHEVSSNIDQYRNISDQDSLGSQVITAKLNKGAFMRMSLFDLMEYILAADPEIEAERIRKEDSNIAEIPYEELTEDDKFYIKVYRRARDLLNRDLFLFLDSYRMIPKNARMHAFKYYYESAMGREIILNSNDPLSVYLVIDGSMRLDIDAKREGSEDFVISCKRNGKKPFVIKTFTMPIMLLESGSILFLKPDCYRVGIKEKKKDELKPKDLLPKAQNETSSPQSFPVLKRKDSDSSILTTNTMGSQSSATKSINSKASRNLKIHQPPKLQPLGDELYRVKLVFDKFTTYLKIPFANFERILGDEKLILRSISDNILNQLNAANNSIFKRITRLQPWIEKGNISFNPTMKEILEIHEVNAPNLMQMKLDSGEEIAKDSTIGAFGFQFNVKEPVDDLDISDAGLEYPNPPAPPKSKLRSMIEGIKEKNREIKHSINLQKSKNTLKKKRRKEKKSIVEESS